MKIVGKKTFGQTEEPKKEQFKKVVRVQGAAGTEEAQDRRKWRGYVGEVENQLGFETPHNRSNS